jgi:hypothetical protein
MCERSSQREWRKGRRRGRSMRQRMVRSDGGIAAMLSTKLNLCSDHPWRQNRFGSAGRRFGNMGEVKTGSKVGARLGAGCTKAKRTCDITDASPSSPTT